MQFENIEISKIKFNHRLFEISFLSDLTSLKNSIQKRGIVQPVQVKALGEEQFQIISGFRRVACAQALGLTDVPALVVEDNLDALVLFERVIEENFFNRKFNLVEKAWVIQRLEKNFQVEKQEVVQKYLPFLGLNASEAVYQFYQNLLTLNPALQEYSIRHHLPTHVIEEWFKFDEQDQKALIPFVQSLHFSVSTLKEFLIWIYEISLRDRSSISDILSEPLEEILKNSALDGRQKFFIFRQWLKNKRYPMLSNLEERFVTLKKKLHLPLESSEFFEDNKLHMKFSFQNKEELKQWIEKIKEASLQPELDELLKIK